MSHITSNAYLKSNEMFSKFGYVTFSKFGNNASFLEQNYRFSPKFSHNVRPLYNFRVRFSVLKDFFVKIFIQQVTLKARPPGTLLCLERGADLGRSWLVTFWILFLKDLFWTSFPTYSLERYFQLSSDVLSSKLVLIGRICTS